MEQAVVEIREYRPTDKEAVMAVWLETGKASGLLSEEALVSLYPIMRDYLLPKWKKYVAVAAADHKVVGYIALKGRSIHGIFILPEYQDRGLGQKLLDRAVRRKGQLRVPVYSTNTLAKEFYENYGFVNTEERFDPQAGITEVLLELPTEPSTVEKVNDFCLISTLDKPKHPKLRIHSKHFQ